MKRLALMLVLLAGCQPRPQALLPAPSVATTSSHYAGSTISGPTTRATFTSSDVLLVHVRWVALAKMPTVASTPLGARARLLLAGNTDSPLLGSAELTSGVRIVEGPAAASLITMLAGAPSATQAPIAQRTAALLDGVTPVFRADVTAIEAPESVELKISRSPPEANATDLPLQCSFSIAKSYGQAAEGSQPSLSETALFDWKIHPHSDGAVLLIPISFSDGHAKVLALGIEIRPAVDSSEEALVLAKCQEDVTQSAQAQAARLGNAPVGISQSAGIIAALRALDDPQQRRASLVYLANAGDASLCLDTALVADGSVLADLSQRIQAAAKAVNPDALPALGWALDRCAFELLTSLADSPESGKLPPELATVLTQFCGEAARHSASLDEIARGMNSETDLRNRLVAQNLVFLTDSSPAARVRAFDWLSSRHLAPAGYDPLAPARDRRMALDRATTQPQ